MGRHKKIIDTGDFTDDHCFSCKDGGHLRVCDYKNCLKAYHPDCVGKDHSFLMSNEHWTCGKIFCISGWHSCSICQKSSAFQCFCCPRSLCQACIRAVEFVQIKKKMKGFCSNCLKLAILIEENADIDSDGGKVNFQNTETYKFLFKDYWQLVKEKEGLTLVDLHAADALLKRGQNCKSRSDSDLTVGHLKPRQLDMGNGSIPNEKIVKEDSGGISIKGTSVTDIEDEEEKDTRDRKAKDHDEEVPNGLKEDEPVTDTCEEISSIPVPKSQKVWHYIDPSGNEQGPFPMFYLRYWMEEGFFDDDFKVWRTGQPQEQAILLTDALRLTAW